ncbi:Protein mahjong [Halotydeus destructor]|nr:Protein mahjong [Halotydeus destructor]
MALVESSSELHTLLGDWEKNLGSGSDPVPTLQRIAELIEKEIEAFLKMDPDPFDDRHPSRARPDCSLGITLKTLFKNDEFMQKLVNSYALSRDNVDLQTVACRLLIDLLPGLESSIVFNDTEGLVARLFQAAEHAKEPLKSFAIGLLAAAMDVTDVMASFKDQNMHLAPLLMRRLGELSNVKREKGKTFLVEENVEKKTSQDKFVRPFSQFKRTRSPDNAKKSDDQSRVNGEAVPASPSESPTAKKRRVSSPVGSPGVVSPNVQQANESNSSWADLEPYVVGSVQMSPLTVEMQQRFILQYLSTTGDYQELLIHVFENNILDMIMKFINLSENHDIRLAFEACKYLASLLCHKKFALEFLNAGGLQQLLKIYRPSVAAAGVSICLYYLAYSEDAMEKVCSLPKPVLSDMVSYALWLLECSHDSSRCHATMFFGLSFAFRVILELFDGQDGLRKLMNVLFLLDIFTEEPEYTDDELLTKRQTARHVCMALKRYFEAHLVIESELLRRSTSAIASSSCQTSTFHSLSRSAPIALAHYKAFRPTPEQILECVENLLELMPLRFNWKPIDDFLKLGGVKMVITLVAASYDWNYTGKADTIRNVLDVLMMASVVPKFQLALTESISLDDDESEKTVAMRIILAASEHGEIAADPEVQKSALRIIINCVCGPVNRISGLTRLSSSTSTKKRNYRSGEDILSKMWTCIRANNGIMILMNLLQVKVPITDADAIRALACKALLGLARCETVRQIIGKLPLFNNGQLQTLMKEPVLQDKRTEHVKFCKYCMELIVRVTGTPVTTGIDASPDTIHKAEVVAQTKIVWNEKELLQLIYDHLKKKGYNDTASVLQNEAGLPIVTQRLMPTPWPSSTPTRVPRAITMTTPISLSQNSSTPSVSSQTSSTLSLSQPTATINSSAITATPTASLTSLALRRQRTKPITKSSSQSLQKPQIGGNHQPTPVMKKMSDAMTNQSSKAVTLNSIVTEYLRKQHALCKNPIVTCPPFDLFTPHRCPEPLNRNSASICMPKRFLQRQIYPPYGGLNGQMFDRKYVYSKFRPVKTYRDMEGASSFTACAFSYTDSLLFLGTLSGELCAFNSVSGVLEATYTCHESDITYIEPSRDGKSIITCSIWRNPYSALWNFTDLFDMKMSFDEDSYVEYGKQSQDKAVGTHNHAAHLYDLNAGLRVQTFSDENISNKYMKNKATLNYSDELLLNDGVLWDVRSSAVVHKLDKFNQSINGVFHPNGWEIISNSEIWDMRTFHLLKTVPQLDQCRLKFNETGTVIYGAVFEDESSEEENIVKSPYGSSFRTFDALDYSNIATIDVKKNIFDLAVGPGELYIAVVENSSQRDVYQQTSESVCRLYEVGRSKDDDDEEADEEDEDDEVDDDDSDDDILDNTDDILLEDSDSDNSGPVSMSGDSVEDFDDEEGSEDEEWSTEDEDNPFGFIEAPDTEDENDDSHDLLLS